MARHSNKKPSIIWRDLLTQKDCINQFKNRLIIKMRQPYDKIKNSDSVNEEFALRFGHSIPPKSTGFLEIKLDFDDTPLFDQSYVKQAIEKATNLNAICFTLECLLNSLHSENEKLIKSIERAVKEAVDLSPGIDIDIKFYRNKINIRPSGDLLLDKHVVDEVIGLLGNRRKISKHFKEALKIFASGESSKYRNALDNLRFAVEALLKDLLKNNKSLENQKIILLPWLNNHGVHQQIINMYTTLLFGPYSIYQNEAVKHNEEFGEVELEFIIYLTGTFMRLLLILSKRKVSKKGK